MIMNNTEPLTNSGNVLVLLNLLSKSYDNKKEFNNHFVNLKDRDKHFIDSVIFNSIKQMSGVNVKDISNKYRLQSQEIKSVEVLKGSRLNAFTDLVKGMKNKGLYTQSEYDYIYKSDKIIKYKFNSSLRLFCCYNNRELHILFLDPYHLFDPDAHYNQNDTRKYSVCISQCSN